MCVPPWFGETHQGGILGLTGVWRFDQERLCLGFDESVEI